MCFSPEADLTAGLVLGVIAADALRRGPRRSDLPLALFPAVLAVHSLIEAVVWYAGRGQVDASVGTVATYAYLFIAFVVLPTLVPVAIWVREPDSRHRWALTALVLLGLAVSTVLGSVLLLDPVTATLDTHFIRYTTTIPVGGLVVAGYVLAICGAGLLSSARMIRAFAMVNVLAVAVLTLVNAAALTSLWCGWAVVTSVAIVSVIRRNEAGHDGDPLGLGVAPEATAGQAKHRSTNTKGRTISVRGHSRSRGSTTS